MILIMILIMIVIMIVMAMMIVWMAIVIEIDWLIVCVEILGALYSLRLCKGEGVTNPFWARRLCLFCLQVCVSVECLRV